jgi:hypothetical protein
MKPLGYLVADPMPILLLFHFLSLINKLLMICQWYMKNFSTKTYGLFCQLKVQESKQLLKEKSPSGSFWLQGLGRSSRIGSNSHHPSWDFDVLSVLWTRTMFSRRDFAG